MPRYYFALEGDKPEPDGEVLLDDAAARRVANRIADELGRGLTERPGIEIYRRDDDTPPLIIDFVLPQRTP